MASLRVNTLPAGRCITAFVANADGMPRTGLRPSDFKLASTVEGADGALVNITKVTASPLRGFYVLDVAIHGPEAPRRRCYIFELLVQHGYDHGRALASVTMR